MVRKRRKDLSGARLHLLCEQCLVRPNQKHAKMKTNAACHTEFRPPQVKPCLVVFPSKATAADINHISSRGWHPKIQIGHGALGHLAIWGVQLCYLKQWQSHVDLAGKKPVAGRVCEIHEGWRSCWFHARVAGHAVQPTEPSCLLGTSTL